jgi:hypothetical protein
MNPGVILHMNLYILGSETKRSTNYFDKLELAIITAAFNYAVQGVLNLEKTVERLYDDDIAFKYIHYLSSMHIFTGQVNAKDEITERKVTFEKQSSSFGRLFLHSVFEALELFGTNIEKAVTPPSMTQNRKQIIFQVNDPEFHGVKGFHTTMEEFSARAKIMFDSGLLVANSAGLKQSFVKLPEALVDLSKKDAVTKLLEKCIDHNNDAIGKFVDSKRDTPVIERSIDRVASNEDRRSSVSSSDPSFESPRSSTSSPLAPIPSEIPLMAQRSLSETDSVAPIPSEIPLMAQRSLSETHSAEEEVTGDDPQVFESAGDEEISGYVDNIDLVPGLRISNTHGGFKYPRNTKGVLKFYDMGLTFYPSDTSFSFIPSGIHAVWVVNQIMDGARFRRVQNSTCVDSNFNNNLFKRLRQIENKQLLVQMIGSVTGDLHSMGITVDDANNRLSDPVPITDMEKLLLDYIQEEIELSQFNDSDVCHHDAEEIMKIVMKSKFNSFPIFATNGMISNVHTGKFRLVVSRDDDGKCTIKSDNPGGHNSKILGMQIYSPFTRKASRKRVVKGHGAMMRFPTIVQQMLFPDTFFHEEEELSEVLNDFTNKMDWLKQHQTSYLRDLLTFANIGVRMEFFMEYSEVPEEEEEEDDDNFHQDPEEGDVLIDENLHRVTNLASSMCLVDSKLLKSYLERKLSENMKPFDKLCETIKTHKTGGTLPNLTSLEDNSKAAFVVHAELLIANLDFHPYVPKTLLKMMKHGSMSQFQKIGSWRIPERFHVELSTQEKRITGLKYGINSTYLKKRVKVSTLGDPCIMRERDSELLERASKYKKKTRLPVFYLQAVDKVKAILHFFSRDVH